MRKSRKSDILAATIRLVAQKGVNGSTIRQIAAEAGVTEGAVYRHFDSKADLCHTAYCSIVEEMAAEKEQILKTDAPVAEKLADWVRVSYEYFDRYPEAFAYVLLTEHDFSPEQRAITRRQGRILMTLIEEATTTGSLKPIKPAIALSHFSGVMLNVPRLISEAVLEPPASQYVDEVVATIRKMFETTDRPVSAN